MTVFFFVCGVITGLLTVASVGVYVIFLRFPAMIGKTVATLKQTKHEKNKYRSGPPRSSHAKVIKHYTRCTYAYSVAGKAHRMKVSMIGTPRQAPFILPVVYLSRLPRIHYRADGLGWGREKYVLNAIIFAILTAILLCFAFLIR